MPMVPKGKVQFVDANGRPLSGGTVDFYVVNTTTRKDTFSDQALSVPNANPVVLDARGEAVIWGTGSYRQVLKDSTGSLIWDQTVDSSVGGADLSSQSGAGGAAMIGFDGGTLASFLLSKNNRVVDSFATLRTISKTLYTRAFVDGSTKSGFGFYWCDLSDTTTADDGWRTIVAADGGRWKRAEGALFDITLLGVTAGVSASQSAAIAAAQAICAIAGKIPYLPAGTYTGSVAIRTSNSGLIGEGASVTKIVLPATTYSISSFSMAGQVATVTTSTPSGVFVGQGISIKGTSASAYNVGYIVTAVLSSTQFQCKSLNYTFTDGTATGGNVSEGNVCDVGQLAYGNASTAIAGIVVRGITFDGNRSNRTTPPDDLTDWGIALTNTKNYHISDVRGVNCWQGGFGAFINSNYGYVQAYVENCGFSAQNPAGFDINSSSYNEFHCTSSRCNYGARVLDNCVGNVGTFVIDTPTQTGFVYGNQNVNYSSANNFRITVINGCSIAGVQITAKCYSSELDVTAQGTTGPAVHEVQALGANASEGNTYRVNSKNCSAQSVLIGGNNGKWFVNSWQDGRSGAAGASFAIDVYGNRNQIDAVVEDSSTPQVRGIAFRSGAVSNDVLKFTHNTLVQEISDASGGYNFYEESGWTTPSFGAGWSNTYGAPFNTIGYRKLGKHVRLKGTVTGGTGTIFTLPTGYAPITGTYLFPTVSNGAVAVVAINTAGVVSLQSGSAASVNLDHISIPIDA